MLYKQCFEPWSQVLRVTGVYSGRCIQCVGSKERDKGMSELGCGNYYAVSTDSTLKFGFSGAQGKDIPSSFPGKPTGYDCSG